MIKKIDSIGLHSLNGNIHKNIMGIKNLNRFLKENCSKHAIRKVQLSQLAHKTVVIDTSIYMYRYISENALMENMYTLISLLLTNNIIPLFVFDGKPPPEKRELLRLRRVEKKKAEYKYAELMDEYNKDSNLSAADKQAMLNELGMLKQQFVRVTDNDIQRVKQLLVAYGVMYYESMHEADEVCAYMVRSGKAWACMSDDMDMFVYGCTRVLRSMSLLNKSAILYDTPLILEELCMTEDQFRQIMVVSGTDYNTNTDGNLDTTIQLYSKYVNMVASSTATNIESFYQWLPKNSGYIIDMNEILHICDLFTIKHMQEPNLEEVRIVLGKRDDNMIYDIMSKSGFVFT